MLFGRKKDGFNKVIEIVEKETLLNEIAPEKELRSSESKKDLFEYLDELDEEGVPFNEMEVEEQEPKTKPQLLGEFIRERSKGTFLTSKTLLESDDEGITETIEAMKSDEAFKDIMEIQGDKDLYFYSSDFMSDNYAMIAVLVEEKNMPKTIVEMVRWNSKTYPCATPLYYFNNSPYHYTKPQVERALQTISMTETYSDIGELQTGNHVRYLYSTLHMSEKYARALAEGVEYGEYGYRTSK